MGRLLGRRILVVEDEAAIAIDLKELLEDQGATVVGPAADVQQALALVAAAQVDCAVLDLRLGDEDAGVVAESLNVAGVPIVFVTGFGSHPLLERHPARPVVRKPYDRLDLVNTVGEVAKRS